MSERRPLTVVIPNYNGAAVLPQCLSALAAQTVAPDAVVVVDNGSVDGSADAAESEWGVRVHRLRRNTGFGCAANAGVRTADTPLVAVLNSDARPAPDWIDRVTTFARPGAWAWGGVLHTPAGVIESAGDCYSFHGHSFKAWQGRPLGELPSAPYEVFAVPGAAIVADREIFTRLGGFREELFLYYEDVDLAFRARAAGYSAWVLPDVHVEHEMGASSSPRTAMYYIARNALDCYVRNVPELHPRLFWRTTVREFRDARRTKRAGAYVRGRSAGLVRLPRSLAGRRHAQRARVVDATRLAELATLQPPTGVGA
jgi:GT2 family glycosyltransferase